MPQELPDKIEFIESTTNPGYGYVAPIMGMIAIRADIGRRIVRNWNAISKLVQNGREKGQVMCFAV